ncbi:(4Fe-4S)-binding protein [Fulvivirgaceae bacterium LMO-SS25]|tara:strand:- start:521 stop:952 length:432 start_codon:yes stop_codon:yes gene_type:complete
MDEKTQVKEYKNDEITILWKPSACIHSENCWRGLNQVFNPQERPWIDVNGADVQSIKNQIDKCPSGALSYPNMEKREDKPALENRIKAELLKNGPLVIYGDVMVKDAEGKETLKEKRTSFCRCGASANKPFCDGTHKKVNFEG